jgi:hypothetical protein
MNRLWLCLLLLALTGLEPDAAQAAEPVVGRLHPKLCLPTIDGRRTVDLRDFRGQKVLLVQFASW